MGNSRWGQFMRLTNSWSACEKVPERSAERRNCGGVTVSRSSASVRTQTYRMRAPAMVASLVGATIVWSTVTAASAGDPLKFADSQFEPIQWSQLAGWTADDHLA